VALIVVVLTLSAVIFAPFCASKMMKLNGGLGKSAIVALVTLGLTQIIGMVAQHLGPLGGLLGLMGTLAAWHQVIKVVYGTDLVHTLVFMFWHLFFQLLFISVLAMWVGGAQVGWVFGL
jgi:hypothetical protein